MLTIGVDVGGTKIAAGVVDGDGTVIARRVIPTHASDPQAVIGGITKVATELLGAAPAAHAVGIGAAGLVDATRGVFLDAPNLSLRNVALGGILADRLGRPVVLDNDANVAALAEQRYGAGRGHGDQILVTIGTGVGTGMIFGGEVYRGARGMAGEWGHVTVLPDGPRCTCGSRGCLEALVSGNALARDARERAAAGPAGEHLLRLAGGDASGITAEHVGRAADAGDDLAGAIVREAGSWLGVALATIVNALDPEVVIVGGGVTAGLGDLLLDPARAALGELVLGRAWRRPVPVLAARLGGDAGLVGAAILARQA